MFSQKYPLSDQLKELSLDELQQQLKDAKELIEQEQDSENSYGGR